MSLPPLRAGTRGLPLAFGEFAAVVATASGKMALGAYARRHRLSEHALYQAAKELRH